MVTLVTAISGASGKSQTKILQNISKKLAVTAIDEIGIVGTPINIEITCSQKIIIETMHNLITQGDIIIYWSIPKKQNSCMSNFI